MRAGWNPTRRNKNIGTEKSGNGQNNKLTIPSARGQSDIFWERIKDYSFVVREINSSKIKFLVERTKNNYIHASTIDDISYLLRYIPKYEYDGIELIVLRQAKRKEDILKPCWGRLAYYAEINNNNGPAIYLEAVNINKPIKWAKNLNIEMQEELERLYEDGHKITIGRKYITIETSIESVRATQLYRTLLHEIGHWVDFKKSIIENTTSSKDYNYLYFRELYKNRPSVEKEFFAHNFANKKVERLKEIGVIPFRRILDTYKMKQEGLTLTDFVK